MDHPPTTDAPGPIRPAWVAVTPREAFFALGRFAAEESRRSPLSPHLGVPLDPDGIAERLAAFWRRERDLPGLHFLIDAVAYGVDVLGFDPDAWVFELARGVLGDASPTPERVLSHCEQVVRAFFAQRLCAGQPPAGRFDVFATDGGRVALTHIVQTLLANRLLAAGDRVAVGSSVLLPYVEFPQLTAYGFDVVEVAVDPDDWQFPDPELDKLADPAVKAFFLANPPGPELRTLRQSTFDRIGEIVRGQRPDLLVVADEGFGTFVAGFRSLAAVLPASTLAVYSFDRHFGSRGWRLGVVALHHDNAFDCLLAEQPDRVRDQTSHRYADAAGGEPRFIDRMVAESGSVALRHAAGLSLPQQTQVSLFALFFLTGAGNSFVEATITLVARRLADLYRGLGRSPPRSAGAPYYALLDVLELARERHGDDFAAWLRQAREPQDVVAALGEAAASLLPAGAVSPGGWTIRLPLADSSAEDCVSTGTRLTALLDALHDGYQGAEPRRPQPGADAAGPSVRRPVAP
jgi:aspartate 4-decarboxylase